MDIHRAAGGTGWSSWELSNFLLLVVIIDKFIIYNCVIQKIANYPINNCVSITIYIKIFKK